MSVFQEGEGWEVEGGGTHRGTHTYAPPPPLHTHTHAPPPPLHTHTHTHMCVHTHTHIFTHAHTHTCHCTQGVNWSVGHNVVVIVVVKLTVDIILELRISIIPWIGDVAVVGGTGVLLLDDIESQHGLPFAIGNCRADAF